MSTNQWKYGKRLLEKAEAGALTFEREVLRAWKHVGTIHILPLVDADGTVRREEDWVRTPNEWVFGFTQTHGWAASNGKRGYQFRTRKAMESFAAFMARTEWTLRRVTAS